jgi:hypothetical protein
MFPESKLKKQKAQETAESSDIDESMFSARFILAFIRLFYSSTSIGSAAISFAKDF